MQRTRLPLKGYVLLVAVVFLFVVSVSIVLEFAATEYPTHSDVFWTGVEFGALAILLLVCLFLIGLFLYRLTMLLHKPRPQKKKQ